METLNEQLKNSIEEKTGTRPTGDTVRETLDSASGEENSTLADALVDFIDELPGGGGVPNVSNEITLDGNILDKESYEIDLTPLGGGTATIYKISDDVLPFGYSDGSELFEYTCIDQDDQPQVPKVLAVEGYVIVGGGFDVISAYFDNYQPAIVPVVLAPSVGTWVLYDDGDYYKSITATPVED